MAVDPPVPPIPQLQIDLPEEVAQGMYVNLAMLTHSDAEFTFDFIYLQPQAPKAKVRARIITSPQHAKHLAQVLLDNLARYEARHGPIGAPRDPGEPTPRH